MINTNLINVLINNKFSNLNIVIKLIPNNQFVSLLTDLLENNKKIFIQLTNNPSNIDYFANGCKIYSNNNGDEGTTGRMIVSDTSINLARLGLKYKNKPLEEFYNELSSLCELAKNQMCLSFETIGNKTKENYQTLFTGNILDDDKLESNQKIRKVIKNGVLSLGIIGLKECVINLEPNKIKQIKLINDVLDYLNNLMKKYSQETKLNFGIFETTNKNARKILLSTDKAIYGTLENITDKKYYELIENERLLSDILQMSYQWRNDRTITTLEDFTNEVKKLSDNEMADDLAELIYLRVLDTDYRMYFYSFPKGSYIKNADEKDICNYIEYPNDYQYEYSEVCAKVARLKEQERLEKVYEAIKRTAYTVGRGYFPKIIFEQVDLFERAYHVDENMCLSTLVKEFGWSEENSKETIRILSNVKSFFHKQHREHSPDEIQRFWGGFTDKLLRKCKLMSDSSQIVQCRQILIEVFRHEILFFKKLYVGMLDESNWVPFITMSEIKKIGDMEISIELMNENNINQESYEEIREVFSKILNEKQMEKALTLHESLFRTCKTPEVDEYLCDFMCVNRMIVEEFYFAICESVKQGKLSGEIFTQYLNELDTQQILEIHLAPINTMDLDGELKEEIIEKLLKQGYYELPLKYYCYKNELEKVDFKNDPEKIIQSCEEINRTNSTLIPLIRSEIIKQNDGEGCEVYKELFWNDYPLISIEEMQQFKEFQDAMYSIDASNLEEEGLQEYLEYINAKERIGEECYSVFDNLFRPDSLNCKDAKIINIIISGLDYDKVQMMTMSDEQLTEILGWLSPALKLTVVDNVIESMKLMKWILPEYEKLILNRKGAVTYIELINELNLCTEYTIEWITGMEPQYGFNTVITTRLLESEHYEHYLVGKILFEQRFDYPMSDEVDEALVSLYCSDSPVIKYLSQSDAFVEKLMKDKSYTSFQKPLDMEIVEPFYRVKQTYHFMRFMIEKGSDQHIIEYLRTLNEIETQEDSGAIAKLLINHIRFLEDETIYNHVKYRLWENSEKARGYKGTLTQKRNEYLKQIGKA